MVSAADFELALQQNLLNQQVELGLELGAKVEPLSAVYLDTRYWIILRDAQRGVLGIRGRELLGRLRGAVSSGQAFCPVSEASLFEVSKQSEQGSRLETAALMDELSRGILVLDGQQRWSTEIAHFIHTHAPGDTGPPPPLRRLVWTRPYGFLGFPVPTFSDLELSSALEVQHSLVARLWDATSVSHLVEQLAPWDDNEDFGELARQLNRDVGVHKHGLKSFQQTYSHEAAGAADISGDIAMAVVADMARAKGIEPPEPGSRHWLEFRQMWCGLIAAALRKGPPRQQLRSLHVGAALHAAFRWNKGQKFDVNDLFDFEHAGAALSHCQAFLTERPLAKTITSGKVALDKLFACQVIWDMDEAIAFIRTLSEGAAPDPRRSAP
ncbi:MAG: hypothetical protein ACREE0_11560 [Phenylobacterium sp.]